MITELKNSLKTLKSGGTLLYPTDTVWGLGCDATNKNAIAKVYAIKKRQENKSLIVLVADVEMLKNLVYQIPESVLNYLKSALKPTTVIYNHPKNVAENIIANDNTLAIRIVKDDFCKALITKFGKPIVSTSANYANDPTPLCFDEINPHILEHADYVVNLQRQKKADKASTILKLDAKNHFKIIRP